MEDQSSFDFSAKYSSRIFEKLIGGPITQDSLVAATELIANAWDAGATAVHVEWPEEFPSEFSIKDDGHGMSPGQFSERFTNVGYDRRENQPSLLKIGESTRLVFGRNGLGRFAGFHFSDAFKVQTSPDGIEYYNFCIERAQTPAGFCVKVDGGVVPQFKGAGTRIYARVNEPLPRTSDAMRKELSLRFLSDPSFQVFFNGVKIDFDDLPPQQVNKITIETSTGAIISIVVLDTRQPDSSARQHGVAWHVLNRLVGVCSWKGPNGERFLDGRRAVAKRHTFIVIADHLAEAVSEDWTRFQINNPLYEEALELIEKAIVDYLDKIGGSSFVEVMGDIRNENFYVLNRLSPKEVEVWESFVSTTQKEVPTIGKDQLSQVARILAQLQETQSEFALLSKLENMSALELNELNGLLEKWTVGSIKKVMEIVETRVKLIHQLQKITEDVDTLEVQDLQPLMESCLWMFGPEFESVEYAANVGMTKVIQKLFKVEAVGSANRPDFAIVPDGSASFFALPKFSGTDGEEVGVDQLVIVELKRPAKIVSDAEKDQPYRYAKELKAKGLIDNSTRVRAYVLGHRIDPTVLGEDTKWDGAYRVVPISFTTLLSRADKRMFQLKRRLENDPAMVGAK